MVHAVGFLVLPGIAAAIVNCESGPSNSGPPSAIPSAAIQEGASQVKRWASLRTLLEKRRQRVAIACDDKSLEAKHRGAPGRVLLVDARYLARFETPYASPYQGTESAWRMLTHSKLQSIDPQILASAGSGFADALLAARDLAQFADYWGILDTSERLLPRVDAGGYSAGSVSGWLVVVDPVAPRILCQAAISAASGEEVARTSKMDATTAVRRDFSSRVRRELEDGLRSISRQLVLLSD